MSYVHSIYRYIHICYGDGDGDRGKQVLGLIGDRDWTGSTLNSYIVHCGYVESCPRCVGYHFREFKHVEWRRLLYDSFTATKICGSCQFVKIRTRNGIEYMYM